MKGAERFVHQKLFLISFKMIGTERLVLQKLEQFLDLHYCRSSGRLQGNDAASRRRQHLPIEEPGLHFDFDCI